MRNANFVKFPSNAFASNQVYFAIILDFMLQVLGYDISCTNYVLLEAYAYFTMVKYIMM